MNLNGFTFRSYKIDFLVENSIEAGEYVTLITADDGNHFTSATVTVNVLPAGTPEPEPTQSPPTTQRPTGETETEDTTVEGTLNEECSFGLKCMTLKLLIILQPRNQRLSLKPPQFQLLKDQLVRYPL